ncbi:MAG TPA: 6-phosphogluconolactonase [Rhodanobacteraceae bacterium]|nr:6-phosphogluconolactonase [Rhodanobacteraceae bacterium]
MAPDDTRWHGVADSDALHSAAYQRIVEAATLAIASAGRFAIVLAGGNTPRAVYRLLRDADTDWSRWHVWFGDERCLPGGDAGRNSAMAGQAWLDHVPIPARQCHVLPAEQGAEAAARAYAQELKGVGMFDLVLLGLGEDGHTASLFPGHDWGTAADAPDTLAVFDAPKPPPERVSLGAARLARARAVLFLVDGETKRDAVARWRAGAAIPARAIRPAAGVDVLLEASLL